MALTRKPGPAQTVSLIGQIPSPPPMPKEVLDRFDSMTQWQSQFTEFWNKFTDQLQRDRDQLQAQFKKDEADAASNLTRINNSLASIQTQLSNIITGGSNLAALTAQVNSIAVQVSSLISALADHIAAYVVHGTSSQVVGTTDVEGLDGKTIGKVSHGYGRFQPLVGSNLIPAGQAYIIGASDFMLGVGTLTVSGVLKVDGVLLWL